MAQAARDPYVILITIYIFAPYFVTRVASDPVTGQALVAAANKWGGWAVMLTAPLLGAYLDRRGPRKPLLAVVIGVVAALAALLWFVPPAGSGVAGLPIWVPVGIAGAMAWLIATHELLHNALLLPAAGMTGASRASGLALAGGNAVSVALLLLVLLAFALPGTVPWGWLPTKPLFGLDPALGEPARITGPIVAVVLLAGSWPLFTRVPDLPPSGLPRGAALRAALGDLAGLMREARSMKNPLIFLAARMIFTDGLTAILVFGGLYAAGVMRWGTLEMLGYGIILSAAAVAGGLLASRLDGWFGPKRALMAELALLILAEGAVLGLGRERLFYQPHVPQPVWDAPFYRTLPELAFLGVGCIIAITVTSAYASSRTLLTRVAPPERMGVFFGLYALSGTATMWLGPLLVEWATRAGGSQAAGMAPVIGLLSVGLLILGFVRGGDRGASAA